MNLSLEWIDVLNVADCAARAFVAQLPRRQTVGEAANGREWRIHARSGPVSILRALWAKGNPTERYTTAIRVWIHTRPTGFWESPDADARLSETSARIFARETRRAKGTR